MVLSWPDGYLVKTVSKTIRLFLEGIGRPEEYEYYLNKFNAEPGRFFCVVCPDPSSVRDAARPLVFDLNFLQRIELPPLLLFAGEQAEEMFEAMREQGLAMRRVLMEADGSLPVRCHESDEASSVTDELALPTIVSSEPAEKQLKMLVPAFTDRVHWVSLSGALHSAGDKVLDIVYLNQENEVRQTDALAMQAAEAVLQKHPRAHISITSPMNFLRELFTVKGAGTLIKPGSALTMYRDVSAVDQSVLASLIERSFGKPIDLSPLMPRFHSLLLDEELAGAALFESTPPGIYLSKFAVTREMQGLGLAQELWDRCTVEEPAFFWRCRPNNPIVRWYHQHADGWQRGDDWHVFWRGMPLELVPELVAYSLQRPGDFQAEDA